MKALIPIFALSIVACASTPLPSGFLVDAESAIERAIDARAEEHAPIEVRFAREKLAGARLAIEERNAARAARLAEQSLVNSELAMAKVAAAEARAATREQQLRNDMLREDLGEGN